MIRKLIVMATLSMLLKRSIRRPSFSAQPIFLRPNYFEEGFYLSCTRVGLPETCPLFRTSNISFNFVK
ncbi:hypothetical protein AMTRI_Chr01g127820 [Amborella trichopoda]